LFDIIPLSEFVADAGIQVQSNRSEQLMTWYSLVSSAVPNVRVVEQELVDLSSHAGQQRFREINASAIAGGYEGIMVKDPGALYELKRSHAWLKVKPVITMDLEVKALEEGTGKNEGKLGALVCEGVDNGRTIQVNVGSGFSDEQRDEFWLNASSVTGELVEVMADAVTQNQDGSYSLRFPRFVRFRNLRGEKI
jgi:DNA ligase-1